MSLTIGDFILRKFRLNDFWAGLMIVNMLVMLM